MTQPSIQLKHELRAKMRQAIGELTAEQLHAASVAACARLTALEAFDLAAIVMLYLPLTGKIDITPAAIRCFSRGQTVCVPKVDWQRRDMQPVEVCSLDDRVLETDEHGVRCPRDARPVMPGMIDVVVVPGLAFDSQGRRLGRGGGYYDRFLKRLRPNVTTIGLAFDWQIIDEVPAASHDIAVDIVVSDRRVTMAKAMRSPRP